MQRVKSLKVAFITIMMLSLTGLAFAHGGGRGGGMGGGGMMGGGMNGDMMNNGYGDGYDRSDRDAYDGQHMGDERYGDHYREDSDRMEGARGQFDSATRQLQQQIRDKRNALDDELSKIEPDRAKASRLQKELSKLQSEYDQKALEYRLESRKNVTDTPDR